MSEVKSEAAERTEDLCQGCGGSGTVTLMTGHLGPDDYNYDADCEACHGTGSADIRDAIKALSYQPHTVKPFVQMVDRAAVLKIVEARAALLAADGWQPIETAPRDSTSILIYTPNNELRKVREAWWSIPYEGSIDGCWQTPFGPLGRGYIILEKSATHWMPLPEPPQ